METLSRFRGQSFGLPTPQLTSDAKRVVEHLGDDPGLELQFRLPNGRVVPLPASLTALFVGIVESASHGDAITTVSVPEELTTTVAAKELGVSRPTLMKLIRKGDIPSHKVGTHTRVKRDDLLQYRAERERVRQQAFKELLDLEESRDR